MDQAARTEMVFKCMQRQQAGLLALGLLLSLSSSAPGAPAAAESVDLATLEGWDIVVDSAAPPSEHYAAMELQRLLAQAAGQTLPIRDTRAGKGGHVFVGPRAVAWAGAAAFKTNGLGPEDSRIVVKGGVIAIAGGRPRGTLYGIYTFLEDYVGVRFLTADYTHVPRLKAPANVGPMDRTYRPPLALRWSFYGEMGAADFAVRMRCNMVDGEERLGGSTPLRLINHSFGGYVPWSKYGKEHPEYFNGPENPGSQLCLTSPDVLRIVTKAVLDDLAQHPDRKNISVSQNDNTSHCRCARCREIDEREGSPMGSLLIFVNAVAAEVAKHHPDVLVGTLAYKYSRRPPRTVKPLPNVQIQLCSIECCMNHAIDDPDCPLNKPFCRDMAEWGNICDKIYIWHYMTNFADYLLPCPNLQIIRPDIRYFVEHGAKGIMLQGAWNTRGGEFAELRNYVASRLLWDPGLDDQKLIDEFLDLYYAEAADPIRRFMELARSKAIASGRHQRCSRPASQYGLDYEVGAKGLELFTQAGQLARTDEVRRRVEKAGVCAYAMLAEAILDPGDREEMIFEIDTRDGKKGVELDPDRLSDARPYLDHLLELCERHGIRMPSESTSVEQARERMRLLSEPKESRPR